MKGGAIDMPKKADDSLKTESGLYKSKLAASRKYDSEAVHNVRLRVPASWWDKMQNHVDSLPEYEVRGKDHHSVNSWIVGLIAKELHIDIENNV